jgi:hypothetical protein
MPLGTWCSAWRWPGCRLTSRLVDDHVHGLGRGAGRLVGRLRRACHQVGLVERLAGGEQPSIIRRATGLIGEAAEIAARTLALPGAQSVEDLTALLTSAGER